MKIALATMLLLASACLAQDKPKVQIVSPQPAVGSRTYPMPGRTEPIESTTIYTRATGIVAERRFDIGDRVKAGDVLAKINAPEIDRQAESAQAAVDQAKARARNARSLAERAAPLVGTQALSQDEYDRRLAEADELDAAVRISEAEANRLKELIAFETVTAPFDGTISERNFDRGDRTRGDSSGADEWLYRLVKLDQLRYVIAAPPELALQMNSGTSTTINFTEFPGRDVQAKFYRSSKRFDETSGTMRVEMLIENADLTLPAGLTGTALFTLPPSQTRMLLPTNAVMFNRGKAMVASVESGRVKMLEVAVGRNLGTQIEVTSAGLKPQTQVIVNPNSLLRDNDGVEVQQPQR